MWAQVRMPCTLSCTTICSITNLECWSGELTKLAQVCVFFFFCVCVLGTNTEHKNKCVQEHLPVTHFVKASKTIQDMMPQPRQWALFQHTFLKKEDGLRNQSIIKARNARAVKRCVNGGMHWRICATASSRIKGISTVGLKRDHQQLHFATCTFLFSICSRVVFLFVGIDDQLCLSAALPRWCREITPLWLASGVCDESESQWEQALRNMVVIE